MTQQLAQVIQQLAFQKLPCNFHPKSSNLLSLLVAAPSEAPAMAETSTTAVAEEAAETPTTNFGKLMQLLQSCNSTMFKCRIWLMKVAMMLWLIQRIKGTSFVARIRNATTHWQQKSKLLMLAPAAGIKST